MKYPHLYSPKHDDEALEKQKDRYLRKIGAPDEGGVHLGGKTAHIDGTVDEPRKLDKKLSGFMSPPCLSLKY